MSLDLTLSTFAGQLGLRTSLKARVSFYGNWYYRVTEGAAVAAPVDRAVEGCVVVSPTAEPGCWVGFSVPAACGRPFVVFGADWLEFPAGGL